MKNSYERVFGMADPNNYPIVVASVLNRIKLHTQNISNANKVLELNWGEYISVREHTGVDLRCALIKKSDVETFHGDNVDRFIRLGYKSYEVHLYFDEQVITIRKNKAAQSKFKTPLPDSPLFDEVITTTRGLLAIEGLCLSDLVFADTETTGLFNADHVIELGVVDAGERVLFDSMLKPKRKRKIHPMALKAHGITESKLAGKPRLIDVQNEVMECLKGRYVVFYNAHFDVGKMLKSSDGHIFDSCSGVICLMKLYKDYNKKYRNTSLIKACDSYGVNYRDVPNHRAVGDAIKTARLCSALLQDMTDGQYYINNAIKGLDLIK